MVVCSMQYAFTGVKTCTKSAAYKSCPVPSPALASALVPFLSEQEFEQEQEQGQG